MKNLLDNPDIELISVSEINIELDKSKTVGYDFTVEDFYTFRTHDGVFVQDTMMVSHPLTDESQQEAREKMMRLTSGTSSKELSFGMMKEIWAGLYTITKDKKPKGSPIAVSDEDLKNATDPFVAVKYRGVNTTMGKAIFNRCFPKSIPFQHGQSSKKLVGGLLQTIHTKLGDKALEETGNRLKDTGFKWATIMAPSMNLDAFILPPRIYKIKDQLVKSTPEEAQKLLDEALEIVKKELRNTGFGDLADSGATKGWGQPLQILVAKGIIADPEGNILDPIAGSFADGLSNKEFFDASQGARKGIIDRTINTADTGYMSRKLAYLLNTVEVDRRLKDCKTKRTLDLKLDDKLIGRFQGRFVIKNNKLIPFEEGKFKVGDIVQLRSPIFCTSKKVCHTCYGRLIERHRTPYVGILASQIIGERGTQLIMKTFHTGGAVTIVKRSMLQDIINNDPLSGLNI